MILPPDTQHAMDANCSSPHACVIVNLFLSLSLSLTDATVERENRKRSFFSNPASLLC